MPVDDRFELVIAANRLPVDRVVAPDGSVGWHRSPGGLVTAMESVMAGRDGVWVGWAGEPGEAPEPFDEAGMRLHPIALSAEEIEGYYEGFSNDTLWPIYHDVIVPAQFHREWWHAYREVNERFAQVLAEVAADGATVWVHDYQLQLVPAFLRQLRPDVRIGWFNHIPFPPVELFAQLPWRAAILEGLLGADFLGFQRRTDAGNFRRACRQLLGMTVRGDTVTADSGPDARLVRAAGVPISTDFKAMDRLARTPEVRERAKEIRASSVTPSTCCSASTGSTTPRASGTGSRPTRSCWLTGRSTAARPRSSRSRPRAGSGSTPTSSSRSRSRAPWVASTASTPPSAPPPWSTSTAPTGERRWPRCSSPPTSWSSPRCATA
ncbi:hypothetical protein GCM10025862_27790 [Arsenicicoccus piscis]|uniref:Trehalose-6-phosphate synthase n=1 Tax=Arsenicicoccus piscis TaxID=673954 RepID=A0ABQ6HQL0_9MICO|nr:hypothetical protein GCM10025862_27790 [Arsenicicoccus piscis]